MAEATKRNAVVTGANKGIGFTVCKQLASKGITVVLTARDEKKGLEAVEKLKDLALPGLVVFHQLDVTDPASIGSFADFIRNQFGKLDILINNAGIGGADVDSEALAAANVEENVDRIDWSKILTESYELTEAALKTNYYGAKELIKALIPLLQFSSSPKIVNVSSSMGRLEITVLTVRMRWTGASTSGAASVVVGVTDDFQVPVDCEPLINVVHPRSSPTLSIPNGWPKEVLSDVQNLNEEKIDEVLNEFLKDFKEGSLETKGWPLNMRAYVVSKVALNAYTRFFAKKYPSICINAICPGYVKTDINYNKGILTPDEGAEPIVRLALLPHGSPSGLFFVRGEEKSF